MKRRPILLSIAAAAVVVIVLLFAAYFASPDAQAGRLTKELMGDIVAKSAQWGHPADLDTRERYAAHFQDRFTQECFDRVVANGILSDLEFVRAYADPILLDTRVERVLPPGDALQYALYIDVENRETGDMETLTGSINWIRQDGQYRISHLSIQWTGLFQK